MKLALLINGHLRSYKKTYPSFKKNVLDFLKKYYELDIFMHTWNTEEFQTQTWHKGSDEKTRYIHHEELIELYNPKRLIIEKQNTEGFSGELFSGAPIQSHSQACYSLYQANKIRLDYQENTSTKYDIVLKVRPDIYYLNSPLPEELEQTDKLWLCQLFVKRAACDVIYFSNSENMNKVCSFYNARKYFDPSFRRTNNFTTNEHVFLKFLEDIKIPLETSKFCMPRDWLIFRSSWDIKSEGSIETYDSKYLTEKWAPHLALNEINTNKKYRFFKRQ